MTTKTRIRLLGGVLCCCVLSVASQAQVIHGLTLNLPMSKDGLNNGLLFRGAGLQYSFSVQHFRRTYATEYQAKLSLQGFEREGILGANLFFQPFSYFYGFQVEQGENRQVYVGPKVSAGYSLQVYPELQLGHVLWLTNFSLAPQALVRQHVGTNWLQLKISAALVSVTSRPQNIEAYYFTLRFTDLVSKMHSNLRLSPFPQFSQTEFSADYQIQGSKRNWSVGYELNYLKYRNRPTFQALTHGATFKFISK